MSRSFQLNTATDWTTSKAMSGFEYEIFGAKVEVTCMAAVRAAPSHSSSQGVAEGPCVFLIMYDNKYFKNIRNCSQQDC